MWLEYLWYFLGGGLLANAIPHFVNGVSGRPFQSPFAKPPGQGLSSSTVNVVWGAINAIAGYALLCRLGDFDLSRTDDAVALGLGALLTSLFLARYLGRFHGGNSPEAGPVG
jgi:hypothetical protein